MTPATWLLLANETWRQLEIKRNKTWNRCWFFFHRTQVETSLVRASTENPWMEQLNVGDNLHVWNLARSMFTFFLLFIFVFLIFEINRRVESSSANDYRVHICSSSEWDNKSFTTNYQQVYNKSRCKIKNTRKTHLSSTSNCFTLHVTRCVSNNAK